MGQIVENGINNLNTKLDAYSYTKGMKDASHVGGACSDAVVNSYETVFKYDKSRDDNRLKNTAMDNFEEYLSSQQEKAKEAGEDAAAKEREAKEAAKEIARNLTAQEIKQLEMMGVDMDTVDLSDIRGMVNTMRQKEHRQETMELMAKISIADEDIDTLSMISGTVKTADGVDIEGVSVSDVIAASQNNEMEISNNEFVYIVKNNLPVDKGNLYKAHFSGVKADNNLPEDVVSEMLPQLERVIEQAGFPVNDVSMSGAKLLINNDLPVTTDNIREYMDFQQYIGKTPKETDLPEIAARDESKLLEERAQKLFSDIREIAPEEVFNMASQGKQVTIASVLRYIKIKEPNTYENTKEQELKAVTAMRQMEEIRLSMTQDMAARLVKLDMNVDTRELSKVVAMLKDVEQKLIGDTLKGAGVEASKENISLYQQTAVKVREISEAGAKILGAPLMDSEFTIDGVHSAIAKVSETNFEGIRRSYEAVGTAPRCDMGDSISKAFSNVDDMLKEMSLPVNYENQRAVRILGYNSLPVTAENIQQVVWYDRQVNDMINGFYPEAVLGMIKDGINPMDVPIDELNKVIQEKNYNKGVTEAKNFAAFLRDVENKGELSKAERESYIGMYRVLEGLAKSGDREAGWIFANGSRLTVRNIVSAMRSRKAKGFDVEIDDSFGMLQDVEQKGKKIDAQISSAFDSIKDVSFEVEEFIRENSIPYNAINVKTITAMLSSEGGIYSIVSELLSKLRFNTKTKDRLVDAETENISESLLGEDVPIEFTAKSILEHLKGSEEMSLNYDNLREHITELMYQAGAVGDLSQLDIASIKVVNAGFNIMKNLARQEKFYIPVETEAGTKVMNLTIKRDNENRGHIHISISSDNIGNLTAQLKLRENRLVEGFVVSDSSEGNYMLKASEDKIKDVFRGSDYDVESVGIGSMGNVGDAAYIEAEALYEAAVTAVKAISAIIK